MGDVLRLVSEGEPAAQNERYRLVAIGFFDVVGFSSKMGRDESEGLACVDHFEGVLRPEVERVGGRVVKLMGDGAMVEFPTAAAGFDAMQAVVAKAADADPPCEVRGGLHLGEVVDRNGDLFGAAVNIAARIESLADSRGFAMTEAVHAQLQNRSELRGGFTPPVKLKNIPGKTRVFLVPPEGQASRMLQRVRRRRILRVAAAACLAVGTLAAVPAVGMFGGEPASIGLMYVRAPDGPEAETVAHKLRQEIEQRLAGNIEGAQWIGRLGMMDLFQEVGISDPKKIESLEPKSCQAAREGGLDFSFYTTLERGPGDRWTATTKAVCTRRRATVASFETTGKSPSELADAIARDVRGWVRAEL